MHANGGLGWVGMLLWMVPTFGIGIWLQLEQLRFVRLYRRINGVELLPWMREPWRAPVEGVPTGIRGIRILMQRQENPELERLRRRVIRLIIFMVVYAGVGLAFPIAFSYI